MNKIKTLISAIFLSLLLIVSCGGSTEQESIATTKSNLLIPIRVGSLTTNICCTPSIGFMYLQTPTPLVPYMNSTQSAFAIDYKVGYVGSTSSLNTLTFHIYRVNATVNNPFYYIATANVTKDDGTGHIQNLPNIATVSGWPTDQFLMIWENDNVTLTVMDKYGNHTWDLPPVGLSFNFGHKPNAVYPPTVSFVIDLSHGCAHDMPGFDDDVQLDGHLDPVLAAYGVTNLSPIQARTTAPTTNSNCSVSAGWDGTKNFYQWHTGL